MDFLFSAIGRFHPLVVHLPIGMILLGFMMECLSLTTKFRKTSRGVKTALVFGSFFAVIACITGLFLKEEGGYDETLVTQHQYLGIATAVLSIVLFYARGVLKQRIANPDKRRRMRVVFFLPVIILLSLTGHWGGSLTHGESYLFNPGAGAADGVVKLDITDPAKAKVYGDLIVPILRAKCYDCHSASRQKGKLRLDAPEFIRKGGKNGFVIEDNADSSWLYRALVLPIEDKKHMPPRQKPQLSSTEIDLIHAWISDGSDFEKRVSDHSSPQKMAQLIRSLQYSAKGSWVPDDKVGEVPDEVISELKKMGASVMIASADNNYIMVNLTGVRELTAEKLAVLQRVPQQLIWLDAGGHQLTDEHFTVLSQLQNLRMLYLNETSTSDQQLTRLASLHELRYLNLVGNPVTGKGVINLQKLAHLEQLFLYRTKVTSADVIQFSKWNTRLMIDTGGYQLPKLPTDTLIHKRKI
jgi:uncharacterized membrane protein